MEYCGFEQPDHKPNISRLYNLYWFCKLAPSPKTYTINFNFQTSLEYISKIYYYYFVVDPMVHVCMEFEALQTTQSLSQVFSWLQQGY